MSEANKFCGDCGAEINIRAEICPKCGVRQIKKKNKSSLTTVIVVLVVVFGGFIGIGIISAITVPQFSSYRIKGYDAAAKSDIMNAKTALEAYFADKQKYPTSLDEAGFKGAIDVQVEYQKDGIPYRE